MTQPTEHKPDEPERTGRRRTAPGRLNAGPWLLGLVVVILLGAALRAMAVVAIPVVFALLIVLVVAPLHRRLRQRMPGRLAWLAEVLVMALLLGVIAAFLGALVFAAQRVLEAMPGVSDGLSQLLARDSGQEGSGQEGAQSTVAGEPIRAIWADLSETFGGWLVEQATFLAESIASMTSVFVTGIVIVFFIVLLSLTEIGVWRQKVPTLWSDHGQTAWRDSLETVTSRLRRFLIVRTLVGLLQAALYVGWLWFFGVDLLFVWAVLTFVLTYIPNLGSIIAGTLPVLYALVTKDPFTALGVAAGLLVIEQVVGNYLDPRLLGRQIVLSPVVILVGLMFWSWLWGVAGAFLSTPIMLGLLVAFNHIAALRPIALILSNQCRHDDLDKALEQAGPAAQPPSSSSR